MYLYSQAISLQGPWGQVPPLTRKQSCLEGSRNKRYLTVSILSVGVRLEGENRFFDTNRKDRNCILNQKECPLSIEALFNPSINYPQDPKNGLQVTPPQIGLTTIISRRKQKQLSPPQKIAGNRPCLRIICALGWFVGSPKKCRKSLSQPKLMGVQKKLHQVDLWSCSIVLTFAKAWQY